MRAEITWRSVTHDPPPARDFYLIAWWTEFNGLPLAGVDVAEWLPHTRMFRGQKAEFWAAAPKVPQAGSILKESP